MNLNRAQYILVILEEGSISAAARRLFISQAALSQAVRYVEEEVGLPVLERGRGEVKLTYAGERYVETVRQMLLLDRSFRNEIDEMKKEQSGQLRFGIPSQTGSKVIPSVFSVFQEAWPSIRLKITEKGSPELMRLIRQGELDLALIRTAIKEKGITYLQLQKSQMGVLAGKGSSLYQNYPNGTEIDISQAAGEKFVFMKTGHTSRFTQDKLLERKKIKLQPVLELDNFETAKRIIMNGEYVMVASYSSLQQDEETLAQARFYPLKGADNEEKTYLIYNDATYLTPYMKKWIQLIQEIYTNREEVD